MENNDWRKEQIVYQIFPDRFYRVSLKDIKNFNKWDIKPKKGRYLEKEKVWSHEVEKWGGNLKGIIEKLDYLEDLGINTLYLTPIFYGFTNHRYDTIDYFRIDPDLGTLDDLKELCKQAHKRNIKIILDGVFNHVGYRCKWFQDALNNIKSKYREFFFIDKNKYRLGYRAWANVENLPELNIDNPKVKEIIYKNKNSVIKNYLHYIDGWRLDVAYELGLEILKEIKDSAHEIKNDSFIIGEIWNYPDKWLSSVDGIMNYFFGKIIFELVHNNLQPFKAGLLIEQLLNKVNINSLLQSWIILSSHDTPRLKNILPNEKLRELAIFLQFTLPGAPLIYYGEEIGMEGESDPYNRAPMEWNKVNKDNKILKFYKELIKLKNKYPSLRKGDFIFLKTNKIFSFLRRLKNIEDILLIAINFTKDYQKELVCIEDYRLMNHTQFIDVLSKNKIMLCCGMIDLELPPLSYALLKPIMPKIKNEYNPYKRV